MDHWRLARLSARATTLAVVATLMYGCASFSPLLTQSPGPTQVEPSPEQGNTDPELTITEARPSGVLLLFHSEESARDPSWTRVELLRSRDGEQAIVLQEIVLDEAMRERMLEGGISLLDTGLTPGSRYTYLLRFLGEKEDAEAASKPIAISWQEPPAPPGEPKAMALDTTLVELSWQPLQGWGVAVFRRDVLERPPRIERVGNLPLEHASTYLDRTVKPGKVYAYRIAYVRMESGVPIYGAPSGEFYVKTRTADTP